MQGTPEDLKIFLAVLAAAIVKWLMTEKAPPEDESRPARRTRWMRAAGGIGAGILLGVYGAPPLIRNVETLTYEDHTLVAILLCLFAEHLIRTAFDLIPTIMSRLAGKKSDGGQR